MEIVLGIALGIIVIGAFAIALILLNRRNSPMTSASGQPIDPDTIRTEVTRTVNDALMVALDDLRQRARDDRDESIRMASELVTKMSTDQLAGRADLINNTMTNVKNEVASQLKRLDDAITTLRENNAQQYGNMEKAVAALSQRTDSLNEVLSSSQARGQWGERLAEDMLRAAGFLEGVNYHKQAQIEGGGRPDYRFDMPPDRVLYMDVKFPLDKYAEYLRAESDPQRDAAKQSFLRAVSGHVDALAKREYVDKSTDNTIDYVLMFVPNESISGFVHEVNPALIDQALERKVVLCSPLTLYAFLVVIRQAADSFHTERTAADVMRLINNFHKQWEEYTKAVDSVAKSFEKLRGDLDSITTGGTRFRKLAVPVREIEKLRKAQGIPELGPGELDDLSDD